MLGKLMKYEWKSIWKMGVLMLIVMAGTAFLGWLSIESVIAMGDSDMEGGIVEVFLILFAALMMVLYSIVLVSVSIGIYVYLGVKFYKSMYSAEGYLTHTLPVGKHELLLSKIFIDGLWILMILAGMVTSIYVFITSVIPDISAFSVITTLFKEYGSVATMFEKMLGMSLTAYIIFLLVAMLITPFFGLMCLYGSISLGQLFRKARVLMAIVIYFGMSFVIGILQTVLNSVVNGSILVGASDVTLTKVMYSQLGTNLGLQVFLGVVMYFAAWAVISKKLNLE